MYSILSDVRYRPSPQLPSECWQLGVHEASADIFLQHIYIPKSQVTEFAEHPSVFGGPHDKLVLRAEIGERTIDSVITYHNPKFQGGIFMSGTVTPQVLYAISIHLKICATEEKSRHLHGTRASRTTCSL